MSAAESIALGVLGKLEPERSHQIALFAIGRQLVKPALPISTGRLSAILAGLRLANPLGLAAGFDKNAVAFGQLLKAGFGFVEVGTVTPEPQYGNPRPRHFRLTEDQAAINRYGFNSDGQEAVAKRLSLRKSAGIVGVNIGANSSSKNRAQDFASALACCGRFADYATINVSSPNTEGLRNLQSHDALESLVVDLITVRNQLPRRIPLLLKISPDLTRRELEDIVLVTVDRGIDGIIATNTTASSREHLRSRYRNEKGGLSGAPLFEPSTRILARLYQITGGKLPLVGVGGIGNAEQAFQKITAGATALQLYTSLAYKGLSQVNRILTGLDERLAREGFRSVSEAVGTDHKGWL